MPLCTRHARWRRRHASRSVRARLPCAALAAAVLAGGAPAALACSCAPRPLTLEDTVANAWCAADVVLTGRVESRRALPPREGYPNAPFQEVRLRRIRALKGTPPETLALRVATESALCGIRLEDGASYLVFGASADGGAQVSTDACSLTAALDSDEAAGILRILDATGPAFDCSPAAVARRNAQTREIAPPAPARPPGIDK